MSQQINYFKDANIDGLVQDCSISSALAMETLQSWSYRYVPLVFSEDHHVTWYHVF